MLKACAICSNNAVGEVLDSVVEVEGLLVRGGVLLTLFVRVDGLEEEVEVLLLLVV